MGLYWPNFSLVFLIHFFLYAGVYCICNRVRSVSFSDGGLRDHSEMKLILYFVSLAAWLTFRHAKLTAGGERRVRILAIESLSFFLFFFPSHRFSIFSRSNSHTHTNKEGAKTHGRAERRQERFTSCTRFLDYRLMFDSGRSFSLKYFLIRPLY